MKKLALLLVFLYISAFSQNETVKEILRTQDLRMDGKSILPYLKNDNAVIATKAAKALANMQDTTAIENLISSMNDSRSPVSAASAFALGMMGVNSAAEDALLQKLRTCDDKWIKIQIFEALGRTGSSKSLEKIIEAGVENENILYYKILALARYGLRKIKNEESVKFIFENSIHKTVQSIAAYALFRMSDPKMMEPYTNKILNLLNTGDDFTKMWIASLIGTLPINKNFEEPLWEQLKKSDWKVQINTLKALEKYPLSEKHLNYAISKINDENEHIALAAIRYFKNAKLSPYLPYAKVFNKLISIIENKDRKYSFRIQGEAAITFANLAVDKNDAIKFIKPLLKSSEPRLIAKAITALSDTYQNKVLDMILDINSKDKLVQGSVVNGISAICSKTKIQPEQKKRALKLFESLIGEKDLAVVATIAEKLRDSVFKKEISAETLIRAFDGVKDNEAKIELIKTLSDYSGEDVIILLEKELDAKGSKALAFEAASALKKITGKSYEDKITYSTYGMRINLDINRIFSAQRPKYLLINTAKGKIKIKLNYEDAPFTVLNFIDLANYKFFDGLAFHRVVSNFVIQGGDPRGDGWGGPGYSIRTEIGMSEYKRGSVGVASSGKDTEGCQFFITHSPQPHLDGRYTIFGEVIEGMDSVDRIMEGDKIISVKAE